MTNFSRSACDALAAAIVEALKGVEQKYGVSIKRGRGTYTENSFSLKVECSIVAADGTVRDRRSDDFAACADLFGLQASDLGRSFTMNGKTFTITGAKPRAHKMPILATGPDGRGYKFTAESVRKALGVPAASPREGVVFGKGGVR